MTLLAGMAGVATGASTGGAEAPRKPVVRDVICVEGCAGIRTAAAGGLIQVSGKKLKHATEAVFPATSGGTVRAPLDVKSARLAEARVPSGARTGRIRVGSNFAMSRATRRGLRVTAPSRLRASGGAPVVAFAEAKPSRFYYGARSKARYRYIIRSDAPISIRVDVVRQSDGAVVRSWIEDQVPPNTLRQSTWDGTDQSGSIQREGRYNFRIGPLSAGAKASSLDTSGDNVKEGEVDFYRHTFPIRGRYNFGHGGGSRFGSDRGGRRHRGQDVFARCGTPLVAARGGTVKWRGSHRAAGHYLVIDGDGTGTNYAYMHLRRRVKLKKGERVYTGQRLGEVGASGNARGCHLHFELWSAPGWYEGGKPFNPLRHLKSWAKNK